MEKRNFDKEKINYLCHLFNTYPILSRKNVVFERFVKLLNELGYSQSDWVAFHKSIKYSSHTGFGILMQNDEIVRVFPETLQILKNGEREEETYLPDKNNELKWNKTDLKLNDDYINDVKFSYEATLKPKETKFHIEHSISEYYVEISPNNLQTKEGFIFPGDVFETMYRNDTLSLDNIINFVGNVLPNGFANSIEITATQSLANGIFQTYQNQYFQMKAVQGELLYAKKLMAGQMVRYDRNLLKLNEDTEYVRDEGIVRLEQIKRAF